MNIPREGGGESLWWLLLTTPPSPPSAPLSLRASPGMSSIDSRRLSHGCEDWGNEPPLSRRTRACGCAPPPTACSRRWAPSERRRCRAVVCSSTSPASSLGSQKVMVKGRGHALIRASVSKCSSPLTSAPDTATTRSPMCTRPDFSAGPAEPLFMRLKRSTTVEKAPTAEAEHHSRFSAMPMPMGPLPKVTVTPEEMPERLIILRGESHCPVVVIPLGGAWGEAPGRWKLTSLSRRSPFLATSVVQPPSTSRSRWRGRSPRGSTSRDSTVSMTEFLATVPTFSECESKCAVTVHVRFAR
jgi:hypothetical protein